MKNKKLSENFFKNKIIKIFENSNIIIDIGGGLRVSKKSNRYDIKREWILPFLEKVDYKILDPVSDYNPDIIGDIHNLPFNDNSIDAILCIAVLEHVENPIKACQEIYRVLKPGGKCFVYVPFLYYYHAHTGYYKDYWRFTEDSIDFIFKDFKILEKKSIRGAIETWLYLSPLGKLKLIERLSILLDKLTNKTNSKQVSGYNIYLEK